MNYFANRIGMLERVARVQQALLALKAPTEIWVTRGTGCWRRRDFAAWRLRVLTMLSTLYESVARGDSNAVMQACLLTGDVPGLEYGLKQGHQMAVLECGYIDMFTLDINLLSPSVRALELLIEHTSAMYVEGCLVRHGLYQQMLDMFEDGTLWSKHVHENYGAMLYDVAERLGVACGKREMFDVKQVLPTVRRLAALVSPTRDVLATTTCYCKVRGAKHGRNPV